MASDIDLAVVAKGTPGFSGADLENLVNEAAILAARRDSRVITQADLLESTDKVRYGPERRSRVLPQQELEITAYHEAGHAVVSHYLPDIDPIHKITIVPRGVSGGMTSFLPENDKYLRSRTRFEQELAVALGGRAAEEVVFGEVSTGSADDLERVTRTARDMVTRFGMSDVLGPMTFGDRHELVFLGRDLNEQRNYSEAVARQIDNEVRRFVNDAYDRARGLVSENVDRVHAVAKKLLEVETLDRVEFEKVILATELVRAG
jgi:cell division protease FtsH